MNWEETVRNNEEETRKSIRFLLGAANAQSAFEEYIKSRINAQAKLTWEARQKEVDEAEQRGIQKVVDWIKDNNFNLKGMDNYVDFGIDSQKWQAFCKRCLKIVKE